MSWQAVWHKFEAFLFPPIPDPPRALPWWQYLLFVVVGVLVFALIGYFLPATGLIGYDWVHYFSLGEKVTATAYYPPWIVYVSYLTWPGLIGFTFTGLALALYQRRASRLVMGAAFFTLPVFWVIFLGQVDGLLVLGLTGLPWLVPLATIKPQVTYLAFFTRKQDVLALIIWLAISIIIWGFWPLDLFKIGEFSRFVSHDIHLWPWSLPLVILLLWFSRGDADMLMLAGTFSLPYLHPYHYIVITPALARVAKWVALLAIIVSWLPLLSNWFGDWAWYLGHLFPIILWLGLYTKRRGWLNGYNGQVI
ncbi:MAG: hypothetical protein JW953_04085 [Anaerolineae bacterium]|nr:hypothetical protein [Anaerolineae bacterium]